MNLLFNTVLSKEDNLLKRFEEIHDFIYANDGLSPQQTLEEFVKVLFIKIFDENTAQNQFFITADEQREPSVFQTRTAALFDQTKQAYQDIFDADDRIRLSVTSLMFTINKLQTIALASSSQDAKGLAFQKFLSHHEKQGNGQFFTPEPVIDFCVAMMEPQPHEKIIDPACGSGGFLLSALKYLESNNADFDKNNSISTKIFGIDLNKSIARIAKMKLLLENNGKTNIFCANSLDDIDNLKLTISPVAQPCGSSPLEGLGEALFDIVLANPPFGAKINQAEILKTFDLGCKWQRAPQSHQEVAEKSDEYYKTKTAQLNQPAELLFVERCLDLLKEGGRMAIVLPNGNFENPSLDYFRYYIKLRAKLLAIVNLPQETFIPYGTGVKTSLLFLEKETPNKIKEYPIFFGRIQKLGYQGNKNGTPLYRKNEYGQVLKNHDGQPILDEDFTAMVSQYKAFKKGEPIETANSYSIGYNELNGRFDYDFYAPENRQLFANTDEKTAVRLGDVCEIIKIKSKKLKDPNSIVEYVELSDINTHSFEIINTTTLQVHELPSRASYELQNGDIITAIAGNSVGTRKHATAFVTEEHKGIICTNGFRVFRNVKIDIYFFLYFLKSDSFLKQMFMYRTGAAIPNVSDTDLANILIYLPTEAEQQRISTKVKRSFELRKAAKLEIETI
jgi:type I restriction enzyme M protein